MMKLIAALLPVLLPACFILSACQQNANIKSEVEAPHPAKSESFVDLSKRDKPASITDKAWHSAVFSAPDIGEMARLWREIGGYETVSETDDELVLRRPNSADGYIKIIAQNSPNAKPARPLNARAWDTGCYWSLMMRAKDIPSIIKDANSLGWKPLTKMAFLEFGTSKLNIIVLRHQLTGAQVQLYERLTTPLPKDFPEFERLSQPFNIMQTVKSQTKAYDFFQQTLGFETFHFGAPVTSAEPTINPLGIPKTLTTKIPYKAAIVYPQKGMEWGRFEMIEIEAMEGARDFSDRCHRGNWGLLEVHYQESDIKNIYSRIVPNESDLGYIDIAEGAIPVVNITSPDGARIVFNR